MKFGKEFKAQMVPEWQEAYMDYHYLKNLLKELQPRPQRKLTLVRAFSGLTQRHNHSTTPSPTDVECQDNLVNSVEQGGSGVYEIMSPILEANEGEIELVYFKRLDEEFNKVVQFYRSKVEEVMNEAAVLNKQMDALIAFRVKMARLSMDVAASTAALSATTPSAARSSPKDVEKPKTTKQSSQERKPNSIRASTRPAPLQVLRSVKMNNTMETPRSTIKGCLNVPQSREMNFTRENLEKVQNQLKRAFVEFYHKLRLLKSYSFMNTLAFSKIMKKYDKITSKHASKAFLKKVDDSYLGSSNKVTKLMERVESTFIKHFSNSNRGKGMKILRQKAKKENHKVTFTLGQISATMYNLIYVKFMQHFNLIFPNTLSLKFFYCIGKLSGFFAGCSVSLLVSLIMVIHTRDLLIMEFKQERTQYMQNMFPLYSFFGFIVLHMLMYAGNIYFWQQYRVNYSFIFGFKQGTQLGYREVFFLSFGLSVLAQASVLSNLDLDMDPKTKSHQAITELVPLALLVLVIAILFCPFNIIYRSSRFFFLTCLFHCICAPLYKVTLPDFFLADQLTSQVQAFRSFEFFLCYYGMGDYRLRQNTCKRNDAYNAFLFIVAAVPYWCRFLQCLRRLFEEKDPMQGYNGLKYFSTIVAVSVRTAYGLNRGLAWRIIAFISSAFAAVFSTYWDLVFDWGLLQKHSKNPWLRDKLLIPYKIVYFGAMVLNVLLRLAWLQTVLNFKLPFLHTEALVTIVACLEIIRRGIWNFFRIENEHLNNVGKYRAFKSVPLPFNYDEEDEERDE
ncbi:hypothetical protein PVL29_001033 [Vitis rotundifolia]|uniref:Uncharacterized protein n=1 Tax=Vitis rotundifolia TaxID=103349 RepID=A0AA39AP37_VITRO|nr:hypothetical protein PVL29_001033 [Vitis rotundifolia]